MLGKYPLLALALLLAGCSPPVESSMFWSGYGFEWDLLSHRIAYFRAGVRPAEDPGQLQADLGLIGGPFSTGDVLTDEPAYALSWRTVDSGRLRVHYGEERMTVGPDGRTEVSVSLDLAQLGLPTGGEATVALAGVEWDMDVEQVAEYPLEDYPPGSGWTPQGFGAGVSEPTRDGDLLQFDVWSHFKPGPLDRDDMNAAVPLAQVGGVVRYVVAVVDAAQVAVSPGTVSASAYYVVDPPNTEHPPIPVEQRTITIEGTAGLDQALPLLRSWDFELNRSLDEEGRYLRAFSAGIESFDYDEASGSASLVADAFCSLSSLFEEGDLEVDFAGEYLLLQWHEPQAELSAGVVEGLSDSLGAFDQVITP